MSEVVDFRLCLLWEHEIRMAAKATKAALAALEACKEGEPVGQEAFEACLHAVEAAGCALHHVGDDAVIAISSATPEYLKALNEAGKTVRRRPSPRRRG